MPKWCEGTVVDKKVWTEGLFTISINVPGVQAFKAGQFLQLGLQDGDEVDVDGKPKLVNRPYSVASPHSDVLEFFIVLVEDGELTPRLWKLEKGDNVFVSDRAAGSFTLQKTPDAENIWLVGTGTGLAPYIAMLRESNVWEKFKKIIVVHGVRYANDLGYTEELKEFESQHAGRFKLIQSLTREESNGALKGRIPNLLESGELERVADCELRADNSAILLCGNPAMLDSMEELLGKREMKKHRSKSPGQIVLERYW